MSIKKVITQWGVCIRDKPVVFKMMIILSKYDMDQISEQLYYIRCKEYVQCPHCGGLLKVIGSRKRKYINSAGEKVTLIIRRLRCKNCKRIHHELPDILIPYKRYESISIENLLVDTERSNTPAEDSTFYRWKLWFNNLLIRILSFLLSNLDKKTMKCGLYTCIILISFLKNYPRWLAILVRQLVNLNFW